MARGYSMKNQLMARFTRSLQTLAPGYTFTADTLSDGSPALILSLPTGTAFAYAAIDPRSFTGFNVVGEISSSAGEGTPEHIFQLYFKTNASGLTMDIAGLIASLASKVGCSSLQIYTGTAAPTSATLTSGNLQQDIPNSGEMGSTGA